MDCCRLPEEQPPQAIDRCRRCGARGRGVPRRTLEGLLKPEARRRLQNADYYFDRAPECEVVYFSNPAGSYFTKEDLTVRVGIKERESPIIICYCFDHTAEAAREEIATTGHTSLARRIEAEIRAGNCRCEVKNPSGACCLGEVHRVIAAIQEEVASDPVGSSKGD